MDTVADRVPRDAASILVLFGGLMLIGSLFFDWFTVRDGAEAFTWSGWDSLEMLDGVLVFIALAACIGVLFPEWAGERTDPLFLGLLAFVLILVAMFTKTPVLEVLTYSEAGLGKETEAGAFIALMGSLALLSAAWIERASNAAPGVSAGTGPSGAPTQPSPSASASTPPPPPPPPAPRS